jgi:hypothetical protein
VRATRGAGAVTFALVILTVAGIMALVLGVVGIYRVVA